MPSLFICIATITGINKGAGRFLLALPVSLKSPEN